MKPGLVTIATQPQARLFNRELSLLSFHERVLALAMDDTIPLLERVRFLCISCTNLDEFFEVRVARLKQAIELGAATEDTDGLPAPQLLLEIRKHAAHLVDQQYDTYQHKILPALAAEGILITRRRAWSQHVARWMRSYFRDNILPVLSPFGLDPARPFPHIINKSLNFIVGLQGEDALHRHSRYAVVQAPRSLPRLIKLPPEVGLGPNTFVFLASLIRAFTSDVFPGMKILGCHQFRVTRNSDLLMEGEDFDDLLIAVSDRLADRQHATPVRMETSHNCETEYVGFLRDHFGLSDSDWYGVNGPVNLNRVAALYELVDRPDLKYPRLRAGAVAATDNMFAHIHAGDILLHHPYQSFAPVIAFLRQAARDPQVLAIKQSLYRTGAGSTVVDALVEAAQAGKEVTVVIELRARFDEADNIALANRLHEAGAHVAYGVVGFKTHAKFILVVRSEGGRLRRYVHLGTGNYHPSTAQSYTDYGLFSTDNALCEDVHAIFLQLTGLSQRPQLQKLYQSPFDLHDMLIERIGRECEIAREGGRGRIVAKINSLVEPSVIDALYQASQCGVHIDLIVRGMCCLRPQVPGLSDNIRVRSVLGRFLEHSRVYYFGNGDEHLVYCASADWMDRNFFRRVEVCFPIESPALKTRVIDDLTLFLNDEVGTWHLGADGAYRRSAEATGKSVQTTLLARYATD